MYTFLALLIHTREWGQDLLAKLQNSCIRKDCATCAPRSTPYRWSNAMPQTKSCIASHIANASIYCR
jgi:hypothetical protein